MALKWKKILQDPSFWVLLGVNIYLVYRYELQPAIFTTLIWLYFSQSVLFGFFNFLDMLTSKNVDVESYKTDGNKNKSDSYLANAASWLFLMHYGFFHLVYLIFLATMKRSGPFDWALYKEFLLVFFVFQVISFIQHKIQNKEKPAKISTMFALPYLRVIPMHLCILVPAFLNVSNLTVFLVLKVITDLIMYLITTNYYRKNEVVSKMNTIGLDTNLLD